MGGRGAEGPRGRGAEETGGRGAGERESGGPAAGSTEASAAGGISRADALLLAALEEATTDLTALLGPNPATWRWGGLHRVTWRHPLSAIKALAPLLNRGPHELPGDADTVNMAAVVPYPPDGRATHAWLPAYRLVVDLADPTRSVSQLAGGEWGLPGSRHYADQIGAWITGRPHTLLYGRAAIDKAAITRQLLMPA